VPVWQEVQLVRLEGVGQRLGYACATLTAPSQNKAIGALIIIRFIDANDIRHSSLLDYGLTTLLGMCFDILPLK